MIDILEYLKQKSQFLRDEHARLTAQGWQPTEAKFSLFADYRVVSVHYAKYDDLLNRWEHRSVSF